MIRIISSALSTVAVLTICALVSADRPRDAMAVDAPEHPRDFRLHIEFSFPAAGAAQLASNLAVPLSVAKRHDIAIEHPTENTALLRVWADDNLVRGPEEVPALTRPGNPEFPVITIETGTDSTLPNPTIESAWIQPLKQSDHAKIVAAWNDATLEQGRQIYTQSCLACHGTRDQPGSLPTATQFAHDNFFNGSDPHSIYVTLTDGFRMMVPQPQLTTEQKYAVAHYIREAFLRRYNPEEFVEITDSYLNSLPKGLALAEPEREDRSLPVYERMEIGPALFWTYEVEQGNIAQKGIAIRVDDGPGGVSKGRGWMVYDHDTLRLAAATTGSFIDWRGIAFDGSHNSHTRLTGERHLVNPVGPGWASPSGSWEDPRPLGRDGRAYGPLPRDWAHYRGLHLHGKRVVIAADIGGTRVLESPGWIDYGAAPVFLRTVNVGPRTNPLLLRVAPDELNVELSGEGSLETRDGFWVAELPPGAQTRIFISTVDPASLSALADSYTEPLDLSPLIEGGPPSWPETVITRSQPGNPEAPFIADTFPLPEDNPWDGSMRPGGFDFTPDGNGAVIAMWNGDVWRVDGLFDPAPASLRWRRLATGLFQPLGVKYRDGELFITCRDQLARLHDLNGNGEVDYIESFNNDHQVTEHFHEFAMGLQTDPEGNFYYAKSARHALPGLVPHHGTLLRVSADGSRTDILANGFRAANGVLVNDDGTFFVTDQEGHWMPKNRINRVEIGGFYGNMLGYTDVTDPSDSAMEPSMVWITNEKDRSPAELVWVPENVWGPLGGSLLNLSYGTGKVFIVPHEEVDGIWQGAVSELPLPAFETGIMRGRFGPDGALYAAGMFAWAGNVTAPGGFYRIRYRGDPAHVPIGIEATSGGLKLTFSDPIDASSVTPGAFALRVWSVERTERYGADHQDEKALPIESARVHGDSRTVFLSVPSLRPTWFYELMVNVRAPDGTPVEHSLHGTINRLPKP